jgi:RNA-directed DNA polymerase
MHLLRKLFTELKLSVNESKSAVDLATHRKILGYSFWVASGKVVKRRVSKKALQALHNRVREITQRNRGRSIGEVVAELRSYLVGWKEYYRLADTPKVFNTLDEWIRHRLRALHLKQWKRGTTIYRELRSRGMSHASAAQVAANARRWWHNSAMLVNVALPNAYFDQLQLPRLAGSTITF